MNWINSEIARIKQHGRWTDLVWPGYWTALLGLYLILDRSDLLWLAVVMIALNLAFAWDAVTIRELRAENAELRAAARPAVDNSTVINVNRGIADAHRAVAQLEKMKSLQFRGRG